LKAGKGAVGPGDWGSLADDGNAARVETDVAGLFLGADAKVGHGWRLGVVLGHTDGRVRVDQRASRSSVKSDTGAVYGGRGWDLGAAGRLNWLAGAAYTRHAVDSRRELTIGVAALANLRPTIPSIYRTRGLSNKSRIVHGLVHILRGQVRRDGRRR